MNIEIDRCDAKTAAMRIDGEDVDPEVAGLALRSGARGHGVWLDRSRTRPGRRVYDVTVFVNGIAIMTIPPYSKEQELIYIEMEQDE